VVFVASFLSQIYDRLLGACTLTLPSRLRVACVAVTFLCGRVECRCPNYVRCGCTTSVRCGNSSATGPVWETKTQIVGSGRARVIKLGLVTHLTPTCRGNFGHMTSTTPYLKYSVSPVFCIRN